MGGLDGMNSMGGGMGNFKSVSTSTRIVNGKRTTTKKYVKPSLEMGKGRKVVSNI